MEQHGMQGQGVALGIALAANAVFSAGNGLFMLADPVGIAALMGVGAPSVVVALGVGLLAFGAAVAVAAWQPRAWAVAGISLLDLGWIAGTLPFALIPGVLSREGAVLVVAVACMVGVFALLQLWALRRRLADPGRGAGRLRHCLRLDTSAAPAAIWEKIADLGGIARFSDTVAISAMEGGGGATAGAVRACSDTAGRRWAERVELFDHEDRNLSLRFLTEREGFPFPVREMEGGWCVFPGPGGGAVVEVWWSLEPKGRLGWLMVALMTFALDRDMRRVVWRMEQEARGAADAAMPPAPGRGERLPRLRPC